MPRPHLASLFDDLDAAAGELPEGRFVLWFRKARGCAWEAVSAHPTESEADRSIQGEGDWLILRRDEEP